MNSNLFSLKHIPSEKAIQMMEFVQMAGNFKCDAAYVAKRKKYDSILVMATISGKGYLKYRNRNYEVTENMGIVIDCNDPHVYFSDKNDLWHFIWVHFKGGQSMQQVGFILDNGGPIFKAEEDSVVIKSIVKIIELLPKKGIYCDVLASSYLNAIMTELMLQSLPGGNENRNVPDIINEAVSMMESNFSSKISLDDLAKKLYTNKFDLIRKFQKYLGTTPYEYLMKFRINQAKVFLEDTALPVSEIAAKVGFEDPSYFIKVFRQNEKTTPLQFRKFWNKEV